MSISIEPGGRLVARNISVKVLIKMAYRLFPPFPGGVGPVTTKIGWSVPASYDVSDSEISGGPKWTNTDRFDIEAKADDAIPTDQFWSMLQLLLKDRFALQLHHDKREAKALVLTIGRDGRGLKLESVADDGTGAGGIGAGWGKLFVRKTSMSSFAKVLSDELGTTVVDNTGLKGFFNLELTWTPEQNEARLSQPTGDVFGPSIFTAVEEQLGLRLQSGKTLVDVLIIDHIKPPTPN